MVLKGVVRSASFAQSLFKRLADARLGGPLAFEFQNSVPFSPAHAGCFFMPSNETRPFLFPEGKNPLLKMDNVITTAHSLCWTDECFDNIARDGLGSILRFVNGERPIYIVNSDVFA